jgi:hypothetical protein
MRVFISVLVFVAGVVSLHACDVPGTQNDDNYGPPAGYAILAGSVRNVDGTAVANAEIAFTLCGSPIGGFLVTATTDSTGVYRAVAHLPPVGVLPRGIADTLRLRCYLVVARSGVVRDSVLIRFATSVSSAPVTEASIVLSP